MNDYNGNQINETAIQQELTRKLSTTDELLTELVRKNRNLLITQRITNIAVLVLTVSVIILTMVLSNSVTKMTRNLEETTSQVRGFITVAEGSLEKVNTLVDNANTTLIDSQEGIAEALEKLNKVDIDTLNTSIEDLAAIIDPIAKIFGH